MLPETAEPDVSAASPRRKRNPTYDVFEQRTLPDGKPDGAWVLIAQGVRADNDREAIRQAVADRPEDEQYGAFATVLAGGFRQRTRKKRVSVEDDWR